jgi:hypothetical protein
MRAYRLVVYVASVALLLGIAIPMATWVQAGAPPGFWSPYLLFISPAFMLLVLLYIAPRVSPRKFGGFSLAGMAILAGLAAAVPPAGLPLAIYVLGALLLNLALARQAQSEHARAAPKPTGPEPPPTTGAA